MSVKETVSDTESKMVKALEILHDELKAVRSGRASTGLVENIKAEFYGTLTPLKQMATLATPQADMIVIKPFDPASVKEIEKDLIKVIKKNNKDPKKIAKELGITVSNAKYLIKKFAS